jgi:hypothetical protein
MTEPPMRMTVRPNPRTHFCFAKMEAWYCSIYAACGT